MSTNLYIHFFGCSYTAGDELADDMYLPWLKDCTSPAEYYEKRVKFFEEGTQVENYINECKNRAYPAILNKKHQNKFTAINHAMNGNSIEGIMVQLLEQLEYNCVSMDFAVIQIPPYIREVVIRDGGIDSILFNNNGPNKYTKYITESLKIKDWQHYTVVDFIKLHYIAGYLKSKGVPYIFLNVAGDFFTVRPNNINDMSYVHWVKKLKINNVADIANLLENDLSTGWHYTAEGHNKIANYLETYLTSIGIL